MAIHFADYFASDDFTLWTGTTVVGANNSIAIDDTHPYRGIHGVKVHIEGAVEGDMARCYIEDDFSLGDGSDIWTSGQFFFPTGFDCESYMRLLLMRSGLVDYKGFEIRMNSSEQLYIFDSINDATYNQGSPIAVPTNQQMGIELRINVDNAAGIVELWQDGVMIIEQTGIDTLPAANYADLYLGLIGLSDWTGPDDFWFDKVSVQDSQSLRVYVPSGGLAFGGSAPVSRTFAYMPSGGLVFGGAADVEFVAATWTRERPATGAWTPETAPDSGAWTKDDI